MRGVSNGDMSVEQAVMVTERATLPPARKVMTFEATPPGQAPTSTTPAAMRGGNPKAVARLLQRHLRERGGDTDGAVFRSSRGGRLSARQVQYRFRQMLELAGIDRPVTVHSLRHRFATELHRRTGDLQVVQTALGHRHLGTSEVYARIGRGDATTTVVG